MPTITPVGGAAHTPILVVSYSARRRTGTIVHDSVSQDDPYPDVTLRTASARYGTLTLLFPNPTTAQAAVDAIALGVVFTFTHEDRPEWAMTAVPGEGDIELTIQEDGEICIVVLPFQEIAS